MTPNQSEVRKLKRQVKILQHKVDWLMDWVGAHYDEEADAFTISVPPGFSVEKPSGL